VYRLEILKILSYTKELPKRRVQKASPQLSLGQQKLRQPCVVQKSILVHSAGYWNHPRTAPWLPAGTDDDMPNNNLTFTTGQLHFTSFESAHKTNIKSQMFDKVIIAIFYLLQINDYTTTLYLYYKTILVMGSETRNV